MLCLLALLAPLSLIASDLPRIAAWPFAFAALAWAIHEARRYLARPTLLLVILAGRGGATCDGERIDGLRAYWRGPLGFLHWRDGRGRRRHASFWPDTLPAALRRELKLAMQQREAAPDGASVAG